MDLFSTEDEIKNSPPFEFPSGEGYSCVFNDALKGYDIAVPNGKLLYVEHFFNNKISDRSIEYFLENDDFDWTTADWHALSEENLKKVAFKNILWQHDKIAMFGKVNYLPRISAWYGDNDKPYTYSGITLQPKHWNKGLLYIKSEIEKIAQFQFNSVLMNWYRDGDDHISWHTDAEKELGKNPVIASVNFGETRRFLIRQSDDHKQKIEIPLKHGSLLIMSGALQHFWQHSVPKQKSVKNHRFNLTFRQIKYSA